MMQIVNEIYHGENLCMDAYTGLEFFVEHIINIPFFIA
jgi:hypothetical protein